MTSVETTLTNYGKIGVDAIKASISTVSATNKTMNSIRFEVSSVNTITSLVFYARKFFSLMESGRGPRKSSSDQGMKDNILEWMQARGIGSDLPDKKRKQLARFLTLKINKEGDSTYKKGGRVIYTPTITKLVEQMTEQIKKDLIGLYVKGIRDAYSD